MYTRLVSHTEKNGTPFPGQFGFRKKHSTSDAFTLLVGNILNAMGEGFKLLSVFVDLKKAFDSVNHTIILRKLERLGVRGTALSWFASYLTNRQQCIMVGDCVSDFSSVDVGVPQGSLLGVILFQYHIDMLRCCLRFTSSILYADDTTIYVIGRDLRS